MADDDKIIQLHTMPPEVSLEERARKLTVEVERLARLPTTEWLYYLESGETAQKYGIEPVKLKQMVEAAIKANEKTAREAKADDRREKRQVERDDRRSRQQQERARKEAERLAREQEERRKKHELLFAEIATLPRMTHTVRLQEAAKRLSEDFDELHEEFEVYFAARSIRPEEEPWPEAVGAAELLAEIETKFRRYVVVSDAIAAATVCGSSSPMSSKSRCTPPSCCSISRRRTPARATALGVLRHMVQRPYAAVEATGAAVYRIVDRLKPTLLLDEADKLFPAQYDAGPHHQYDLDQRRAEDPARRPGRRCRRV